MWRFATPFTAFRACHPSAGKGRERAMQDSTFEPRLRTGDRVLAALVRLAWIAVVWVAVVSVRSAALSAVPSLPVEVCGTWVMPNENRDGLLFTPEGKYEETFGGVPVLVGNYKQTGGVIRVTNIRDALGNPKTQRYDEWGSLEAIELRVARSGDRLLVNHRQEEWQFFDGTIPHVHPGGAYQRVYWRPRVRQPAPAEALPVEVHE
jgi:hypothetical protein